MCYFFVFFIVLGLFFLNKPSNCKDLQIKKKSIWQNMAHSNDNSESSLSLVNYKTKVLVSLLSIDRFVQLSGRSVTCPSPVAVPLLRPLNACFAAYATCSVFLLLVERCMILGAHFHRIVLCTTSVMSASISSEELSFAPDSKCGRLPSMLILCSGHCSEDHRVKTKDRVDCTRAIGALLFFFIIISSNQLKQT